MDELADGDKHGPLHLGAKPFGVVACGFEYRSLDSVKSTCPRYGPVRSSETHLASSRDMYLETL